MGRLPDQHFSCAGFDFESARPIAHLLRGELLRAVDGHEVIRGDDVDGTDERAGTRARDDPAADRTSGIHHPRLP